MGAKDRVTGRGHQRHIAGVDEACGQKRQRGFGTDRVDDLLGGVFDVYAANLFHPPGGGILIQLGAVVGIPAIVGFQRGFVQGINAIGKRHRIRLTNAHVDQLRSGMSGQRRPLGAFDLFKFVDLGALAIRFTADSLGVQVLNVGVGHRIGDCREDICCGK
jgi:hypothetical protein